jgi:urea transport system substrate-binding protein
MWKQAVEKAKSFDTDKVIVAMGGQTFGSPDGFVMTRMRRTTTAQAGDDRRSEVRRPVRRRKTLGSHQQPWSPYIPGNEKKKDGPEAM